MNCLGKIKVYTNVSILISNIQAKNLKLDYGQILKIYFYTAKFY